MRHPRPGFQVGLVGDLEEEGIIGHTDGAIAIAIAIAARWRDD